MILLSITLAIVTVIAIYFIIRAYKLAGSVTDASEYIEDLETTNTYMYTQIEAAYDNMKELDHKGAFESEDEAGTTFQMLFETIKTLKTQFDNGEETSEEK